MDSDNSTWAPVPTSVQAADQLARQTFGVVEPVRGLLHVLTGWRGPAECLVAVRETPELPPSELRGALWALARARSDAWVVEAGALGDAVGRRRGFEATSAAGRALSGWRRSRLGKSRPGVTLVLASRGEVDFDHPFFAAPDRTVVLVGGDPWALESRAADRGVEVVGVPRPSVARAVDFLRREFGAAGVLLDVAPEALGEVVTDPEVDEMLLSVCEAPQLPIAAEGSWVVPLADLEERYEDRQERFAEADAGWSHHHWRRHPLTSS